MPTFSYIFPNVREHIFHKPRVPHISTSLYERQQHSRRKRKAELLANSEEKVAFFNWIDKIQEKLNMTNHQFANALGVTWQTRMLWKRRSGHYPSQRSYNRLLELEKEARLTIQDFKIIVRVRENT